ncbi:MAG: toluene tolerance protein [Gammaproteobacteria bacterium]|nr:toluene tolerance protein [Gammaproteobacteria bacterium]
MHSQLKYAAKPLHWMKPLYWTLALTLAVLLHVPLQGFGQSTPSDTVMRLNEGLLEIMRAGAQAGFEGRYAAISPVLAETFDLAVLTRLTLGRHSRKLTEEQRAQFEALFTEMVSATYASRFNAYSGQRFEIVSQRDLKRNRKLVRTYLFTGSQKVALDYMLHLRDGRWRIVNVIAQGVSELSLRRSEYAAIITRDGFDGLMRKIRQYVTKLASAS